MEYEVSRQLDAEVGVVWRVLVDVERWPEWTASVTSARKLVGGPLGLGSEVRIKQPKLPSALWRVTDFQPGKSFTWVSRVPGLTTFGFHRLVPESDGSVTVRVGTEQRGPLTPLSALLLAGLVRRHVDTEIGGLKRRCERH